VDRGLPGGDKVGHLFPVPGHLTRREAQVAGLPVFSPREAHGWGCRGVIPLQSARGRRRGGTVRQESDAALGGAGGSSPCSQQEAGDGGGMGDGRQDASELDRIVPLLPCWLLRDVVVSGCCLAGMGRALCSLSR
jgi:hypothetical protein